MKNSTKIAYAIIIGATLTSVPSQSNAITKLDEFTKKQENAAKSASGSTKKAVLFGLLAGGSHFAKNVFEKETSFSIKNLLRDLDSWANDESKQNQEYKELTTNVIKGLNITTYVAIGIGAFLSLRTVFKLISYYKFKVLKKSEIKKQKLLALQATN